MAALAMTGADTDIGLPCSFGKDGRPKARQAVFQNFRTIVKPKRRKGARAPARPPGASSLTGPTIADKRKKARKEASESRGGDGRSCALKGEGGFGRCHGTSCRPARAELQVAIGAMRTPFPQAQKARLESRACLDQTARSRIRRSPNRGPGGWRCWKPGWRRCCRRPSTPR